MRILSVGSVPPEMGGRTRGGVASTHAALVRAWLEDPRVEVVGVIPLNPGRSVSGAIPLVTRPSTTPVAEFYAETVASLDPDVVVFQHVAHDWAAAHADRILAIPAVGVIHSWSALRSDRPYSVGRLRQTIQGLAGLVFPSRFVRREGLALEVAPYGVPSWVVRNPLESGSRRDSPVDGDNRSGVLFVGALTVNKNVGGLMEALSLGGWAESLTVVGSGPLEAALHELTDTLGMRNRVTFTGELSSEMVRERMRSAALVCLPSFSESFGLSAVEALAEGTPVILRDPPFREIETLMGQAIGHGLRSIRTDELAEAVHAVRSGYWDHAELARAARSVFDATAVAREYVDIMESVRTRRNRRTSPQGGAERVH